MHYEPVTNNIFYTALAITCLAVFSATQDIVIDAYRIESAQRDSQSMLSATYIAEACLCNESVVKL